MQSLLFVSAIANGINLSKRVLLPRRVVPAGYSVLQAILKTISIMIIPVFMVAVIVITIRYYYSCYYYCYYCYPRCRRRRLLPHSSYYSYPVITIRSNIKSPLKSSKALHAWVDLYLALFTLFERLERHVIGLPLHLNTNNLTSQSRIPSIARKRRKSPKGFGGSEHGNKHGSSSLSSHDARIKEIHLVISYCFNHRTRGSR